MLGEVQYALNGLPKIIALPLSVGLMMGMGMECTPPPWLQDLDLTSLSVFTFCDDEL